ncbi:phenylacetate--CoA ligase family protein [Bacillus sp. 1P06AnD]|uniref:phenylacetate--CoA ligase family protein n=1 Tax=Bacillus sp. 1P06AnD TaxID=3132208 RepID=UPI0039A0DAAC
METMERSSIDQLQYERLKRTVENVYRNVPFYRQRFLEASITPEEITKLEDITNLPFTTKQDLRDTYPFGMFAVPQDKVLRIHGSSGTSGKPTIVGYTEQDINNWAEIVARAIIAAGGKEKDMFHIAYGYGLFTGGLGLHYGAELLGMTAIPMSGGLTERQITIMQDLKPRGICGTPSYLLNIADRMEEMGIDPRSTSIEYGIFGAEPWSDEMRLILEQKLGIKAVDIYGLSEVMGPGVAIECHEEQNGLHIAEDHFLVEVIDPDTLLPVDEGKTGELVFTSLTKEALPIIRYRTGDIASVTRGKCSCGRTTAKMSRIKGRTDDMIIVRGVNVFPSEMERTLLQFHELVPHYQIHLQKKGSMNTVNLHVELKDSIFEQSQHNLDHVIIQQLRKKIQQSIKSNCLVSVDVTLCQPRGITRSEGKAIRVIDWNKQQNTLPI